MALTQNWQHLEAVGFDTAVSPKASRGKLRVYGKHINKYRDDLAGCKASEGQLIFHKDAVFLLEQQLINEGSIIMAQRILRARPFVENNTVAVIAMQSLAELNKWKSRFVNKDVIAKVDQAIAFRINEIEAKGFVADTSPDVTADGAEIEVVAGLLTAKSPAKPRKKVKIAVIDDVTQPVKRKQTVGQAKGLVKANETKLAKARAKGKDTKVITKALKSAKKRVSDMVTQVCSPCVDTTEAKPKIVPDNLEVTFTLDALKTAMLAFGATPAQIVKLIGDAEGNFNVDTA